MGGANATRVPLLAVKAIVLLRRQEPRPQAIFLAALGSRLGGSTIAKRFPIAHLATQQRPC